MNGIYIWGTGVVLARLLDYRISIDQIEAFIDNDVTKNEYMGKRVIRPQEIPDSFEVIIVANMHTVEILEQCEYLGIDLNKIIFLYNNIFCNDINKDYQFISKYLGDKYADIIKSRYHLIRNIAKDEILTSQVEALKNVPMYKDDYVRVKTLELVADELRERNIQGSLAEVGVFRGEFARCINALFPDKKLYLFDTFEGFNLDEANSEKARGTCQDAFIEAFKNTQIDNVLKKMSYVDKVEIKKGFFPETVVGIDEEFALVSLDVDFEESTFEGLKYFYPRLVEGGYIFIHDYNYGYFDAVKKAVSRYEQESNLHLCKVPIPDAIGSLIIAK